VLKYRLGSLVLVLEVRHPLGEFSQLPEFQNDLSSAVAASLHAFSEVMADEPDGQLFVPAVPKTKAVVQKVQPLPLGEISAACALL